MFSIVLNIIGSLMHFYVAQGLYRIPYVRRNVPAKAWWLGALVVWIVYLAGVHLGAREIDWRWLPGQFALTWLGFTFVMTLCLLVVDLATGFGLWWKSRVPHLLAGAAVAGVLLGGLGIFQSMRAPSVTEYEVVLKDLPVGLDGTVVVALSDLHLGPQRRSGWMRERVEQINALQPSAVLLLGDLVDAEPLGEARLAEVLRGIAAPWGVWAVTGNHEYYGDVDTTMAEFKAGGVHWLRDETVALAPGLRLAGLDDVGRAMRAGGEIGRGLARTLPAAEAMNAAASAAGATREAASHAARDAAREATILLSHIPAPPLLPDAAARGVDLMLSGHTHGGQIWPFNYLVAQRFPQVVGRHELGGMTLVISRGAGSWGPRMRLWRQGEIVKLTLRAPH